MHCSAHTGRVSQCVTKGRSYDILLLPNLDWLASDEEEEEGGGGGGFRENKSGFR